MQAVEVIVLACRNRWYLDSLELAIRLRPDRLWDPHSAASRAT